MRLTKRDISNALHGYDELEFNAKCDVCGQELDVYLTIWANEVEFIFEPCENCSERAAADAQEDLDNQADRMGERIDRLTDQVRELERELGKANRRLGVAA